MSQQQSPYWFRSKTRGWGWGLPARWEGWLFFALWLAAVIVGCTLLAMHGPLLVCLFMLLMGMAFVAVCYAKGEPRSWK
jgi:hypothetical protein